MRMTSEQMEELLAPTYRVGIYCRLSKEDEDQRDGESQSIAHQREIWFPKHGYRYVAINDNIDTMYDDDYAPFKALFNAQYSKDISKKVHSAYINQAEKGRFTGCVAPFGYRKDPENGRYVWDETVLTDMLINPVYCGAVSSQKKNYKFKVGVINEKKPDEWIVVENMHEPIVDQDSFDIVQSKIESRKCSRGDGKVGKACMNS